MTEQIIKKKYAYLFQESLSKTTLRSITKHVIETGDNKPVFQNGERVPIYL